MIYTEMTVKAMKLMYQKHMTEQKDESKKFDKAGVPYCFHPFSVAFNMEDEVSATVALLHDVVEDTDTTFEDLEREFPKDVIDVLRLVTHEEGISYDDYVKRLSSNKIARKVKIADLKHNSIRERISKENWTEKDEERLRKYSYYLKFLEDLENE